MTAEHNARDLTPDQPPGCCDAERRDNFETLRRTVPSRVIGRVHKAAAQEAGRLRTVAQNLRYTAKVYCEGCPCRLYFEDLAARYEQEAEVCR